MRKLSATRWSRREERVEERGLAPRTEPVPVLSWSRRMLCESDVDVGISQVISMFENRSVIQEKSRRDWPRAGQLANPWPAAWPVPSPLIIRVYGFFGRTGPAGQGFREAVPSAGADTWKHHPRSGGIGSNSRTSIFRRKVCPRFAFSPKSRLLLSWLGAYLL